MTNRLDAARLHPLTVRVAIAATVLAALAMLAQWQLGGRAAARASQGSTLAALAETLPLQAASAAGGTVASFDALADSRARLVQVLGEAGLDGDPAWAAVLEQSQAVLDGRATAESVARAAAGARDLTPQVLAATANVARAMGAARPDAFNRQLERFELRARSLEQDLAALAGGAPAKIVANLPYNIGTELLVRWLTIGQWPPFYASMTLMFQREVADRIVAAPDSHAYGRLAILSQWRCHARLAMKVHRSAFTPPPKVMSAIVHLTPAEMPVGIRAARLEAITAAAFGQRRKMLRQSLKGLPGALAALEAVGIDPARRAETLSVEEFLAVARAMETV